MTDSHHTDCSGLVSRTDFASYISAIRNATGNNFTRVEDCKADVCNALWGSGNADISGIGMIIGYILSNVLGFGFAFFLFMPHWTTTKAGLSNRYQSIARRGLSVFFDNAIFFTFAIQTAAIVVLARLNFGVTASGLGDSTVKITWAISLLTMLPPMYSIYIPTLFHPADEEISTDKRSIEKSKEPLRFFLFVICWLLSVYAFLSRMITSFGPSKIGDNKDSVIALDDWAKIEAACYANVRIRSNTEERAIEVFGVAGSLFISLLVVLKLIWLASQRQHADSKLVKAIQHRIQQTKRLRKPFWLPVVLLLVLPLLAISQIWTILRLQQLQSHMASLAGNSDTDGQWTFGQVVAVILFMPVLVECWFQWRYGEQQHVKTQA
ncbi:MAG: hypothetical protein M1812_000824 [Candelaria pacifica]|nr:MAG: hypothetical protein M1812_000824 [Candelaria pacifica]